MFRSFQEVIEHAQKVEPVHVSVAAAHDHDVLVAIRDAVDTNLIVPHLVGNREKIERMSHEIGLKINHENIYDAETEAECAFLAAQLADQGKVQVIMKGLVNSTPFLKGVLNKDLNLKTGRTISHMSAFDIPGFEKIIYMTDGGLNIQPDVTQKKEIVMNAVEFLQKVGLKNPNVALLAANELVNEKMPVTVECQQIMEKLSLHENMLVEGPLPLDLAISKESLQHKGLTSRINGNADLLVVPTIEAGNILGKGITYFAGGTMAGIVLGAKVPLVLVSRSDSSKAKLASLALAVIAQSKTSEKVGL